MEIRRKRHHFIDLYRSAVIILMLEGHFLRAFLPLSIQRSEIFQLHEFFHGLSAPAFLFGAGLTFIISTRTRWIEYHHWDTPLARRVQRLVLVILLGLALHLPYFSFRKILMEGTTAEYLRLFQFDVLHCIGIGLLSLHALVFLFKKEPRFYGLVFSSILAVCFLTPFVWDIDFLRFLPPAMAQMLNGNHGSPFPLFPYVGFLYSGVIVSWEFLVAVEKNREKEFMDRLAIIGCILIIIGVVIDNLPLRLYPTYNYWFTSPDYFLVRIGSLLMIIAFFWYLGNRSSPKVEVVTALGRESLFIYVVHLAVLYGTAVNPTTNVVSLLGTDLPTGTTFLWFLVFFAFMLGIAHLWTYLKRRHFTIYRLIQIAGAFIFLFFFFTRDF